MMEHLSTVESKATINRTFLRSCLFAIINLFFPEKQEGGVNEGKVTQPTT